MITDSRSFVLLFSSFLALSSACVKNPSPRAKQAAPLAVEEKTPTPSPQESVHKVEPAPISCDELEDKYYKEFENRETLRASLDIPPPVFALLERFYVCHHLGGEEPYDQERAEDLQAQIENEKCLDLGAHKTDLQKTYVEDKNALHWLDCVHAVF